MGFYDNQIPVAHIEAMRRYARVLCGDEGLADELVQSALSAACETAQDLPKIPALKLWLLASVRKVFLGNAPRKVSSHQAHPPMANELISRVEAQPQDRLYLFQLLSRFLLLPAAQRETFYLITIEAMSYQETAEFLNISIGTIMSHLSHARAHLRKIDTTTDKFLGQHLHLIQSKE